MNKTKVVGLTGQTGAGKSTVSEVFATRGVTVIDCDKISREVVNDEKHCLADLALEFTIDILNADGSLNRQRLAERAFADKASVKRLNAIILPYIVKNVCDRVAELRRQQQGLIVLDAPTLFESKLNKICDEIIAVVAPKEERLNRILIRDHLTNEEAEQRIGVQHDESFYRLQSTYVLENNGTIHDLKLAALDLLEKLKTEMEPANGE